MNQVNIYYEWSQYVLKGCVQNENALMQHTPSNVFELSFWLQVLLMVKLQGRQIQEKAIFSLHDQKQNEVLQWLSWKQRTSIKHKVSICKHILNITTSHAILRQIQELLLLRSGIKSQTQLQTIMNYLNANSMYENRMILQKVGLHLLKQVKVDRELRQLNDIALANVILTKILRGSSAKQREDILKFIIKQNRGEICSLLKEQILKTNNIHNIQFYLQLVHKLKLTDDKRLTNIHDKIDILTSLFNQLNHANAISKYPYFEKFMLTHSSIRCLSLHSVLYIIPNHDNNISITHLLDKQHHHILFRIINQPTSSIQQCIKYYLSSSDFVLPHKHKTPQNYENPLLITFIKKQFWRNPYHHKVINIMTWMMLENWFRIIQQKIKKHTTENKKLTFSQYKITQQLAIIQFVFSLPVGTFLNYYPIQMGLQWNIFNLPSFSSLVVQNNNFMEINWFSYVVNSQLKNLIKQEKGTQLAYKILVQISDYEKHFGQFLLNFIQANYRSHNRHSLKWDIKILQFYINEGVHFDRAAILKNSIIN